MWTASSNRPSGTNTGLTPRRTEAMTRVAALGGEQFPVPLGDDFDGTIGHSDGGLIVNPIRRAWDPRRPSFCVGHGIVRQVLVIHVRKDRKSMPVGIDGSATRDSSVSAGPRQGVIPEHQPTPMRCRPSTKAATANPIVGRGRRNRAEPFIGPRRARLVGLLCRGVAVTRRSLSGHEADDVTTPAHVAGGAAPRPEGPAQQAVRPALSARARADQGCRDQSPRRCRPPR
jgi:hypothetical protein